MSLVELTEANWQDAVEASPLPVLVDVWAPWCVPCRKVTPIVEQLAVEWDGRLTVGTLNGDDAPRLMARYQVLSLPTLLVLSGGAEVARVVGVPKMDKLRAVVEQHMESN